MSNFFTDNADLRDTLHGLDLARVVRLREDGYAQARDFAYAPRDFEDAIDSYERTLEIAGELAGEYIEPRAEDVDRAGSELIQGEVCYARGIAEGLERLKQADLMGMTLPRRYGGLNFPVSVSVISSAVLVAMPPAIAMKASSAARPTSTGTPKSLRKRCLSRRRPNRSVTNR